MFQELMPLLSQRVLILTLSRVTDEQIRVNVIPKPMKSEHQSDDSALTTPLAVTGTPKELDEQLPKQLVEFVETHLGLSSTLNNAKEQMQAAAKAARESAKKSTNPKPHSGSGRAANPGSAQTHIDNGATGDSDDAQSSPDATKAIAAGSGTAGIGTSTGSLFDLETKSEQ
jgi:PRTRC genetic system protein E